MLDQNNKPTLADQLGQNLPIIGSTARGAFVASHFILALGSGLAIMYVVIGGTDQMLPPWLSYVIAWAGSMIWFKAIENPLRKFILFAWAYRLTDKGERAGLSKNLNRAGRASVWTTLLLLVVTLTLSLLINIDVASGVTTEQDSSAEIAQAGAVTNSYDRDVEALREQARSQVQADADAIAKAEQQAKEWIAQAEASRGGEMQRLAKGGNTWAQGQIAAAVRSARAKGERHIAAVKAAAQAPKLQADLSAYIATRSGDRDTINTLAYSVVTERHAQYKSTLSRRNWILLLGTIFVLFVFVYTARLLVLACLETGEELDRDQGPGVIGAAVSKVGQVSAAAGRKLDGMWKDKFELAPVGLQTSHYVAPNLSEQLSAPLSVPLSVPLSARPVSSPPIERPKQTEDVSRLVSVKTSQDVGKVTVAIDGVQYSLEAVADKMRKWYGRSKTAKTDKSRKSNADKYQTLKQATARHLVCKEGGKAVKIEQR